MSRTPKQQQLIPEKSTLDLSNINGQGWPHSEASAFVDVRAGPDIGLVPLNDDDDPTILSSSSRQHWHPALLAQR